MKKFWNWIGRIYLYIHPRRKKFIPAILTALIIIQFLMLIFLVIRVNTVNDELKYMKNNSASMQSRMYSQLYLMNSRINSLR